MFACPFLEGFSEHWVDYTSDFPLLPLPNLQQQQIPNHPKTHPKIFFSGKLFQGNNDFSKGWGKHLPALFSKAWAHAPQHHRYLRNSNFCSWLPSFSHQNILLLLRIMSAFWVMPNAPSSFPVLRPLSFWVSYPELVLVPDPSRCSSPSQSQQEWGCEPGLWDLLGSLSGHPGRREPQQGQALTQNGIASLVCHENSLCFTRRGQGGGIIQKAAWKVRVDGQKNFPITLFEEILISSTLQSQQPQLGKNYILAHRTLFWHNAVRDNISGCNLGNCGSPAACVFTPLVVCALGCSLWAITLAPPHLSPASSFSPSKRTRLFLGF